MQTAVISSVQPSNFQSMFLSTAALIVIISSFVFQDFQADGEFVVIYIKEIYSPNEFYAWFYKDSTDEYKQFYQNLKYVIS